MSDELEDALRGVDLFEELSRRELRQIVGLGRVRSYEPGDPIVEEGSGGVAMFVLVDGAGEITRNGAVSGTLGPGSHFGEISLIDGGPRTASVTATAPTRCFTLTSWSFLPMLRTHSEMMEKVLRAMCKIIRANNLR